MARFLFGAPMLSTIIESPLKNLELRIDSESEVITGLHYSNKKATKIPHDSLTKETIQQLRAYFKYPTHPFDLPIYFNGTEHQNKLWQTLIEIPLGQTKTYGELAKEINSCAQAIGNACRSNPISIIIPCHRVIAKTSLGGYSGKTNGKMLDIKSWLLKHEGFL